MTKYYLAVDIGASSGRHILGRMENGKIRLEEIHRFKNTLVEKEGRLCWDREALFAEILAGMKKCGEMGKIPVSMGIDTWGVDFVLLDKEERVLGDSVAYRDSRTDGMDRILDSLFSEEKLYSRTGIQKQMFNTIYQLLALKNQAPEQLEQAEYFLMLPEYFHYRLTGVMKNEYTNATTTAMVNAETKIWDRELIDAAGLPQKLFRELYLPGTVVGPLSQEISGQVGYDCTVVLPCTHDTGSAVLSAPVGPDSIYLSSGTWSLMGVELEKPICSEGSRRLNLTNEGGYGYRYRYLKNIMGLWIIQSIKKEYGGEYSFDDLSGLAETAADFPSRIDVNQQRFLAPKRMIDEIRGACADSGQAVPENTAQLMSCVYQSLVESYAGTVKELETITGRIYGTICIVGGGCQDTYLNELTAKATGKRVTAGPVEGTALGNLLVQMLREKEFSGVDEARNMVKASFSIKEY